MAKKVLREMPLSEVDFVGLEEEDLPRTDEPIDVLACVLEYEMKRLDGIERAIEKRVEEGYQPPACEFRGTGASSRSKKSEKKEWKPKKEQVFHVTVSDRHMATRASAREKRKSVLVDEDLELRIGRGRSEVQLSIGRPRTKRNSVLVDGDDLQLSIGLRIARAHSKGKSILVDKMEIGESSSSRLLSVEDTADALEKMDIGEGTSRRLLDVQVSDSGESSKSRKRSKKQSMKPEKKPRVEVNTGPDPPPALPDFFRERIAAMGGVNPVLVLQKALFKTDLGFQQNRLSIPVRAVKTEFLTDEEKALLHSKDRNQRSQSIKSILLDTKGNQWIMPLRLWEMKKQTGKNSSKILALTKPWNKMAEDANNNLVAGDVIQLWAFRIGEKLGFALVKLENDRVDD